MKNNCLRLLILTGVILNINHASANLLGRVVLITGGSSPIGVSIAKKMASQGAKVILTSRTTSRLTATLSDLQKEGFSTIYGVSGEMIDQASANNLFEKANSLAKSWSHPGVDILINNAGTWESTPFLELTQNQIDNNLNVLKGTLFLTQAVVKSWVDRNHPGAIVNIGSTAVGRPQVSSPCLGHVLEKSGISEMSKAVAIEYAKLGIRSNTIALGTVGDQAYERSLPAEILALYPMGRIAQYREVANVVAHLADSEESGWTTATDYHMDGGQHGSR